MPQLNLSDETYDDLLSILINAENYIDMLVPMVDQLLERSYSQHNVRLRRRLCEEREQVKNMRKILFEWKEKK